MDGGIWMGIPTLKRKVVSNVEGNPIITRHNDRWV
jgi:hypothetical protein